MWEQCFDQAKKTSNRPYHTVMKGLIVRFKNFDQISSIEQTILSRRPHYRSV